MTTPIPAMYYQTEPLQMSQSTKQVLNLSCEHINQLFSAKGKTAPAVPLPLEAKWTNCLTYI